MTPNSSPLTPHVSVIGKARTTISDIMLINRLPPEIRNECRGDREISKNVLIEIAKGYESFKIKKVIPIKTIEYPTPATRPLNSVMDCSLLAREFNISPPSWENSLASMLDRLYSETIDR